MSVQIDEVITIAKLAGQAILQIYRQGNWQLSKKADHSPVTAADLAAHRLICSRLQQLTPEIPILSEESTAEWQQQRQSWQRFWLLDPLDGTKEFINHSADFTVNIALIEQQEATLGVVYQPSSDITYYAQSSTAAYKQIGTQAAAVIKGKSVSSELTVVASKRQGNRLLKQFLQTLEQPWRLLSVGSSLKFCLLADGTADLYPRFAPTAEWDTAAAHCILRQAGGEIYDLSAKPLQYNSKNTVLNPFFLAVAAREFAWFAELKNCLAPIVQTLSGHQSL